MRVLRGSLGIVLVSVLAASAAACDPGSSHDYPAAGSAAAIAAPPVGPRAAPIARLPYADRTPYRVHLPFAPDASGPPPLLVALHGYGTNADTLVRELGLEQLADAHGFVLMALQGTYDSKGKRFWNATDACCDFDRTGIDDVGYVGWTLNDLASRVRFDPRRVYVFGHSNGGFLALRLACEMAPRLAGVVSVAGASWKDGRRCNPAQPVRVLQVVGDADDVVRPDGGAVFDMVVPPYPSAADSVALWGAKDHCRGPLRQVGHAAGFDWVRPTAETTLAELSGCPPGADVGLWTVAHGEHRPSLSRAGMDAIWAWLAQAQGADRSPPGPRQKLTSRAGGT